MAAATGDGEIIMSKDFFNARAAIWDEKIAEQDPSKLAAMAARLAIQPGDAVLDVGSGTGIFIPYLLDKIAPSGSLVCLDFAERMLETARSKGFQGNIRYVCAPVEESGLQNDCFDAVVCYSVFPHFEDKPKALSEVNRMLKRGGHLFICHTSSRHHINEIHRSSPEVSDHLFPENDEVYRMLWTTGFRNIEIADGVDNYLVSADKT
jgi:ubiquinone/menaquinone biosynthesis C-methylase UbiE